MKFGTHIKPQMFQRVNIGCNTNTLTIPTSHTKTLLFYSYRHRLHCSYKDIGLSAQTKTLANIFPVHTDPVYSAHTKILAYLPRQNTAYSAQANMLFADRVTYTIEVILGQL